MAALQCEICGGKPEGNMERGSRSRNGRKCKEWEFGLIEIEKELKTL